MIRTDVGGYLWPMGERGKQRGDNSTDFFGVREVAIVLSSGKYSLRKQGFYI